MTLSSSIEQALNEGLVVEKDGTVVIWTNGKKRKSNIKDWKDHGDVSKIKKHIAKELDADEKDIMTKVTSSTTKFYLESDLLAIHDGESGNSIIELSED